MYIMAKNVMNIREAGFKHLPIDYTRSLAFMTVSYNLYLNPGLPQDKREEILDKLYELFTSIKEYFLVVGKGKELFHGPYSNRAPDLVLIPKSGINISTRLFSNNIVERGKWYVHSSYGFVALNMELNESNPEDVDIAPTVLAYLGLPIPVDTDGKILVSGINVRGRLNYRSYYMIARKIRRSFIKISR